MHNMLLQARGSMVDALASAAQTPLIPGSRRLFPTDGGSDGTQSEVGGLFG